MANVSLKHVLMSLVVAGCAAGFGVSASMDRAQAQASKPFLQLRGSWRGGGHVRLAGGQKERISCRAYYTSKANGARLSMAIRCASASYTVRLRAKLRDRAGRVSGSWEETTFNATGQAAGRVRHGQMSLAIRGAVSGRMTISFSRSRQSVAIVTAGSGLDGITISLKRG